jgi:hypothetical protein
VETEQNPEQLFRELMQVSPDGTVPEHLMQRLKEAEQRSQAERRPATAATSSPLPAPAAGPRPTKGKTTRPQRPSVAPGSEEESLYVAFGQLLLEDEEED